MQHVDFQGDGKTGHRGSQMVFNYHWLNIMLLLRCE